MDEMPTGEIDEDGAGRAEQWVVRTFVQALAAEVWVEDMTSDVRPPAVHQLEPQDRDSLATWAGLTECRRR